MDYTLNDVLKSLTQCFGPCGNEYAVREMIAAYGKIYADEVIYDKMGSLVLVKKGMHHQKKIMIVSHMDEVGFAVNKIENDGFLRISPVGNVSYLASVFQRVCFADGTEGVLSMNGSNSVGLHKEFKDEDMTFENAYVDIYAGTKENALRKVQIGDYCTLEGEYQEVLQDRVISKALDNRSGCCAALMILQEIANKKPYYDTYFAFTVLGKANKLGAKTISDVIQPDFVITIETAVAGDYLEAKTSSEIKLGEGPVIKCMDATTHVMPKVVKMMRNIAEKNHISIQTEVKREDDNELGIIYMSNAGVLGGSVMIPIRYAHSANEMISIKDLKEVIAFSTAIIQENYMDWIV